MENCIEIQHLQKSFGTVHAVNDLSLQVKQGELFAFLGINGAGKSTTISMLCGQLRQDAGSVRIQGKDTLPSSTGAIRLVLQPIKQLSPITQRCFFRPS